jgi:hypothetical protein
MAGPDYGAILDEIETLVVTGIPGVRVKQEPELFEGIESGPIVGVFIVDRQAPPEAQRMEAGRSLHIDLKLSILCAQWSIASVRDAKLRAISLAGDVEQVLMANRTLNERVRRMILTGGKVDGGLGNQGFSGIAEVTALCWVVSRL